MIVHTEDLLTIKMLIHEEIMVEWSIYNNFDHHGNHDDHIKNSDL